MRKNSSQKLDKLLLKERNKSIKLWVITAVCTVLLGLLLLGYSTNGSEKVVGEVTGTFARLHEEGHTMYLMVKIPEYPEPIKVRLPSDQLIKKGAQIEINQIETLWFGKSRFSFSKYLK